LYTAEGRKSRHNFLCAEKEISKSAHNVHSFLIIKFKKVLTLYTRTGIIQIETKKQINKSPAPSRRREPKKVLEKAGAAVGKGYLLNCCKTLS
jgi:hypothetical protein